MHLPQLFSCLQEEVGVNENRFDPRWMERNVGSNSRPGWELVRWEFHNFGVAVGSSIHQHLSNCLWRGKGSWGMPLPRAVIASAAGGVQKAASNTEQTQTWNKGSKCMRMPQFPCYLTAFLCLSCSPEPWECLPGVCWEGANTFSHQQIISALWPGLS